MLNKIYTSTLLVGSRRLACGIFTCFVWWMDYCITAQLLLLCKSAHKNIKQEFVFCVKVLFCLSD